MQLRKTILFSATLIALVLLCTHRDARAVTPDGVCSATEDAASDCGKFGKNNIEFIGAFSATCGDLGPCTEYRYQYNGPTATTQLEVLIPKAVQKLWDFNDNTVAGCFGALLTNGQGDPINGYGVNILTHNTCQLGPFSSTTDLHGLGAGKFFIRADLGSASPLAWQAVYSKSNIAADLLKGPGVPQAGVEETAATLTTSEGVSVAYTNVGGEITITSGPGTGAIVPLNQTKLCLPTVSGTPTFTNAQGSFTCETISFATDQCDIKTTGSDPCRFVGGSCVSYSSLRFKDDVRLLGEGSRGLLGLHPVSFRYKPEYSGGTHFLQYGLIAEEVAKIMPELAVYDTQGQPFAVRYNLLPVLLLNELQRQEQERGALQAEVEALRTALKAVEARLGGSARPDGK